MKLAVFDFDGTITRKDTFIEFIRYAKGNNRFWWGIILFAPVLVGFKLKLIPNWKAKQLLFRYYFNGMSINEFNSLCVGFAARINKMVRPKALAAIKKHKSEGDVLLIVSASIENWIAPWAAENGFIKVISTKLEVDNNNLITGNFATKNCYGIEKKIRLEAAFPERSKYILTVYGDSEGDRELMDYADHSFLNPF